MTIENELVVIHKDQVMEVFTKRELMTPLLETIEHFASSEVFDVSSDKGRKAIASMAYRVAQSKTYIESHGKELAAELKELPKLVDSNRKYARDYLDALRDRVRKPLDDWEAEQEAILLKQKIELDHEQALIDHEFWIIEKEAQIQRIAREKAEYEAKVLAEAEARAKIVAEEKARREIIEAEARVLAAERRALEEQERAQREFTQAAEKAKADIEKAKIEGELKAKAEQEALAKQQREEQMRLEIQKNVAENVERVRQSIIDDLLAIGMKQAQADYLLKALLANKIRALRIEY